MMRIEISSAEIEAARAAGFKEGHAAAYGSLMAEQFRKVTDAARAQIDVDGKVGKQLLNELYHDRARLERVVKDAVHLTKAAERFINNEEGNVDEGGAPVTLDLIMGWLTQFRDTHGTDEG